MNSLFLKKTVIKNAVEDFRKEIERMFKGKTVFFHSQGPCAVNSVLICSDESEGEWKIGDMWVTFLPEKHEDDDLIVNVRVEELDKLKVLA
jgi:hypothetical protein